jgi:hypothetical protein
MYVIILTNNIKETRSYAPVKSYKLFLTLKEKQGEYFSCRYVIVIKLMILIKLSKKLRQI